MKGKMIKIKEYRKKREEKIKSEFDNITDELNDDLKTILKELREEELRKIGEEDHD